MELDPETTALIVVDMQQGFCKPDGSLYAERCEEVIPRVGAFLEACRDAGVEVVYTKDTHEEEFRTKYYDEFERWGEHCVRGTADTEIVEELAPVEPRVEDQIIEKGTYDAFHETNLHQYLQFKGIETVLVVGVLTNVCVLHTAASAALHDYRSIIVRDGTEAIEQEDKEYALEHADWLFGEVVDSDEVSFA
ncbi:MAG: isochorismatase family cysteine hydrolase [Candidatus Nanohaloarchaea archaeon]|nr:isochorismatase family cysteine hydrolase [Candidatus Nanohaloarchaea archaeon]